MLITGFLLTSVVISCSIAMPILPIFSHKVAPLSKHCESIVTILGYFNVFKNEFGNFLWNSNGAQYLAAFLMAMSEISNNTDGLLDKVLPNVCFQSVISTGMMVNIPAFANETNLFLQGTLNSVYMQNLSPNQLVLTSAVQYEETVAVLKSMAHFNSPVFHIQQGTEFSNHADYPNSLRIVPSFNFDAIAIIRILEYYKWKKVACVYSTDALHLDLHYNFLHNKGMEINVLLDVILEDASDRRVNLVVDSLIRSGSLIFVLFLESAQVAALMEKAFYKGLFHSGTQIIASR